MKYLATVEFDVKDNQLTRDTTPAEFTAMLTHAIEVELGYLRDSEWMIDMNVEVRPQ